MAKERRTVDEKSASTEEGPPKGPAGSDLEEVDVERDVIGTHLYRERRMVEEVEEVEVEEPRARARPRPREAAGRSWGERRRRRGIRDSLAHKFFYDMVCNRLGLILIGFGTVMILFVMAYDYIHDQPLSLGRRHMLALVGTLVIYAVGVSLELLRVWSWECEEEVPVIPQPQATAGEDEVTAEDSTPIPLVPDDAASRLEEENG
jgi:hypothetical protein